MSPYLKIVFVFSEMGTRVYLGRLPYHVREKDVERFFKGYGKLRDIMLKNGYGFVVILYFDSNALGTNSNPDDLLSLNRTVN
jgi:RNA recognition motif-containing protein